MNKKFSTLLAGAAFLSAVSVNSVYAQGVQDNSLPTEASAYPIVKLAEGTNTGLFQLKIKDSDKVLSMDKDGKLTLVNVTTSSQLANTLWCVTVTSENQGQTHKYDFMNKGTGMMLDITMSDIVGAEESTPVIPTTGGEISGWAFSREINKLEPERPLFSHFSADSIVGFSVKTNDDKVYVQKEGAKKAETAGFAKFTLQAPGQIYLSAEELNTIFGVQKEDAGVKLTFNKDVLGTTLTNPFNANKFLAEESGDTKYLYISDLKKEAYLRVDTAYTNESGTKFLAYNWTKKGKTGEAIDAVRGSKIQDQHKFAFLYSPAYDSLYIYVHSITWNETKANWETLVKKPEATGDNWRVSLQDLIKNQTRILTVDAKEQNTHISFGNMDCNPVASTKTSVADGVYLIKSAKTGKYLAIPLHNDTTWVNNVEKANTAEWASLDLQDANHMPAYQWVVLKKNAVDKNNISPIDAWNREYNTVTLSSVQLNKNVGGKYFYITTNAGTVLAGDSLELIAVDKKFYSDKYLGYKNLTKDELMVNKYTFNYWHPYAADKYIAVMKDSTMTVKDGKTPFTIKTTGKEHKYGYDASLVNGEKGRIPGLAQLVRTMYQVSYDGAIFGSYAEAKENKYTVSKLHQTTDSVYFKENNCIAREEGATVAHYYAIVEADVDGVIRNYKAGVSDYDASASLKAQTLKETRTSAFYIAPDNTPLYRRFNNTLVGENANDAADSLYFVESIRKEYLMDENNTNLQHSTVDYAGIWNKDKANGKLAFRVDTAWLKRGAGEIKPQYLISAFQDVIAGEKIIPCTEDGKHIKPDGTPTENPYECVHAVHVKTPAFVYGKYLVNFSDSAVACKADVNPFIFNTKAVSNSSYTRVGFVPAVQYGDTLLVLTGKYANMTKEQLKNEGIESMIATYKKEYPSFINDLRGDKHKNVTWSFRYVNPDLAAISYVDGKEGENNSFLIESNVYDKAHDTQYQTVNGDATQAIAPKAAAAWLKMQNGCLVLTDVNATFDNAKTGGDGALVFNAFQKTEEEDMVTSNDEIATEGVSVVAGNGTVTVQGAAGKSVVITNILGKVVAETVLTSDNATIAVPAGIVAVAVEGEEAVKTIVK